MSKQRQFTRRNRTTVSDRLLNAAGALDLKPGLHLILIDDSTGETHLTGTSPDELAAARAQGWNIPAAFDR